jgi:hypothetical protein
MNIYSGADVAVLDINSGTDVALLYIYSGADVAVLYINSGADVALLDKQAVHAVWEGSPSELYNNPHMLAIYNIT